VIAYYHVGYVIQWVLRELSNQEMSEITSLSLLLKKLTALKIDGVSKSGNIANDHCIKHIPKFSFSKFYNKYGLTWIKPSVPNFNKPILTKPNFY